MKLLKAKLILRALLALIALIVVLNWTYGRLPSTPHPSGRFVQVDGLSIRYLERPGADPPVLLIHGLPGTAEDFNDVTPLLSGQRTIAIDRPGFGFSTPGYVPFDRQVTVIQDLLSKLHLQRPTLVGHSYGGAIALGFAERHPGEVGGLVLVDAAASCTRSSIFERMQARLVQVMELPVVDEIANDTFGQLLLTVSAKSAVSAAFDPASVDPSHEHRVLAINMKRGNLRSWAGEVLAADGVVESVDRGLRQIRTPTIVLQGEHDRLVKPECGRRLAGELPDARLQMIGGGHMGTYTHPQAVADAVRSVEQVNHDLAHQSIP